MVKSIRFKEKSAVQISDVQAYAKSRDLDFSNAVLELLAQALDKSTDNGLGDLVDRIGAVESFLSENMSYQKQSGRTAT